MFLSLLDLMSHQEGWSRPAHLDKGLTGLPFPAQPEWTDEGRDLILRAQLPGINPRSVQIQVTETSLSLAGYRTHEERVEGEGFYRASAAYGGFARTFPLSVPIVPRQSRAAWREGEVLEIRLRKA